MTDPPHNKATSILSDGQWSEEPVFLVGGGPSLRGFDFSRLDGFKVIRLNGGYDCRADLVLINDSREVIRQQADREQWERQPIITHSGNLNRKEVDWQDPNLYVIKIRQSGKPWSDSIKQGLIRANNLGLMALNMADVLGCNPIYLLGFDMTGEGVPCEKSGRVMEKTAHWHTEYPAHHETPATYYNQCIQAFERHYRHCRRKVYNLNVNSRLPMFEFLEPEKAIQQERTKLAWKRFTLGAKSYIEMQRRAYQAMPGDIKYKSVRLG